MKWYLDRFYDRAFDWIMTLGPRIIIAILLLVIGLWLIKVLNRWLKRFLPEKKWIRRSGHFSSTFCNRSACISYNNLHAAGGNRNDTVCFHSCGF